MRKINKDFNLKIISLVVAITFCLNSTSYGTTLSNKFSIRVPVGRIATDKRLLDVELKIILSKLLNKKNLSTQEIVFLKHMTLDDKIQREVFGVTQGNVDDVLNERIPLFQSTFQGFQDLMEELEIYDLSLEMFWSIYIPLSLWLFQRRLAKRPEDEAYVVGFSGSIGAGKTTRTKILSLILTELLKERGEQVIIFSIDDLYKSREQREREGLLQKGYVRRGPPGTHEVELGINVLKELRYTDQNSEVEIPVFDKAVDNRVNPRIVHGKVGVVFLEGWIVGVYADVNPDQIEPGFKRTVAEALREYAPLFEELDDLIVRNVHSIDAIEAMYREQVHKQRAKVESEGGTWEGFREDEIGLFVRYLHEEPWEEKVTSPEPRVEDTTIFVITDEKRRILDMRLGGRGLITSPLASNQGVTSRSDIRTRPIEAVLYDIGKTLAIHQGLSKVRGEVTLEFAAEEFGISIEEAKTRKAEIGSGSGMLRAYAEKQGKNVDDVMNKYFDWLGKRLDPLDPTKEEYIEPNTDLRRLLLSQKWRGIKLTYATNNGEVVARKTLQAVGIYDLFDYGISSQEAGAGKPDTTMFEMVRDELIKRYGIEASQILSIGDKPRNDLEPALALGMQARQAGDETLGGPEELVVNLDAYIRERQAEGIEQSEEVTATVKSFEKLLGMTYSTLDLAIAFDNRYMALSEPEKLQVKGLLTLEALNILQHQIFIGADVAVQTLKQLGTEVIWGIPGDVTAFFEALSREPAIEFIPVRHEQEGVFAAQGQAIVTRVPAVCYGSLGPGATNLTTGVANAHQDRTPMIVLVDQLKKEQAQDGFHQYIDLKTLFAPICKKVIKIDVAENIPNALREAYQTATEAKSGPVVVILGEDVLTESVDIEDMKAPLIISPVPTNQRRPIEPAIEKIKEAMSGSEFTVAILGPEILRQDAGREVQQFLEEANIPFFTTFMAKGVIPEGHPLCLGAISRHFEAVYSQIFTAADTILTIGFDPIEGVKPSIWEKGKDKKVIHIDEAPLPARSLFQPNVEVTVSLKEFFGDLSRKKLTSQEIVIDLQRLREDIRKLFISGSQKTEYIIRIMEKLRYYLPEDAIVVSDVGNHKQFVGVSFEGGQPVIFPNGLSSIGFALPASMGIKKALSGRPVIAVHGDGGFLLNSQAMETIKRQNLGVIVLLLEDESYGMIRSKQASAAKVEVGVTFSNPDFRKLTESFGWDYRKAESLEELERVLLPLSNGDFNVSNPTVVHMPISYEYDPGKPSKSPLVDEENKIRELVRYFVNAFGQRLDSGAYPAEDQERESDLRESRLLIREFLRKGGKMDWSIVEDLSTFQFAGRMKEYPGLQAVRAEMVIRYLLEFFDIDFLIEQMSRESEMVRPNPEGPSFDWVSLVYRVAEYPEVLTAEKMDFLAGTMHYTDQKVISRLIELSKDDPTLFLDFMAYVWLRCQGREWIFYFTKTYCQDIWMSSVKSGQRTRESSL